MTFVDTEERIELRADRDGMDCRYLEAYMRNGNLCVEGHDIGPSTATVSPDGEYEWVYTYSPAQFPAIVEAMGGVPGEPVLQALGRHTGYEVEEILRAVDLPHEFWCWP